MSGLRRIVVVAIDGGPTGTGGSWVTEPMPAEQAKECFDRHLRLYREANLDVIVCDLAVTA